MKELQQVGIQAVVVFLITTPAFCEQNLPLGKYSTAVKIEYLQFTDSAFDEKFNLYELGQAWDGEVIEEGTTMLTTEGAYFGIEEYANIWENLYIGGEIGYVQTEKDNADWINQRKETGRWDVKGSYFNEMSIKMEYVPVQLNVKYVFEPIQNLILSIGGGISYNYAKWTCNQRTAPGSVIQDEYISTDDWMFGGQIFSEILYKFNRFFIGVSGEYQFTEDFSENLAENPNNFNNFRIGGKIGFIF